MADTAGGTLIGSILYSLNLDDEVFRQKLATDKEAVAAMAKETNEKIGTAMDKVGKSMKNVGMQMTAAFTLPIASAMYESVKASTDFQASMLQLQTQAGASSEEVASLSKSVLGMGAALGFGPQQMAEALYPIESSGIRGAAALDLLTQASKLADVGGSDLTATTNGLVSVMNSGVGGIHNATDAVAAMNAIVGAGRMHMEDLNSALSTGFLATAKGVGLDINSIGAALAFMTNNGVPAVDAATKLNMSMTLLAYPTGKAAKILKEAGVSFSDATAASSAMSEALTKSGVTQSTIAKDLKKPDGLAVALSDLRAGFDKAGIGSDTAGQIIAKAFGGGKSGTAIRMMYQDTNKLSSSYEGLIKTGNSFSEAWALYQESATAHEKSFKSSLADLGVELGTKLLPYVERFVKLLSGLVDKFNGLSPAQQDMIVKVALIVAAIGPLLVIIAQTIETFRILQGAFIAVQAAIAAVGGEALLMLGLWALVIIAVAVVAFEVYKHWGAIRAFIGRVVDDVRQFFKNMKGHWLSTLGEIVGFAFTFWWKLPILIYDVFAKIFDIMKHVDWSAVWNHMKHAGIEAFDSVLHAAISLYDKAKSINWLGLLGGISKSIGNGAASMFEGVLNGALKGIPGAPTIHLPRFANGVDNFMGGMAIVGEHGPEVAYLPPGSSVMTNSQSQQMANNAGSGGSNVTVNVGMFAGTQGELRKIAEAIGNEQKRLSLSRGGI